MELQGVGVRETQGPTEKSLTWETDAGTLTSRWTLGPDGDWWRSEYPVKSAADLSAALQVVRARRYIPREQPAALLALELPMRPWSDLLHSFLGWSEGLMFLLEEPAALQEIVDVLEEGMTGLVSVMAGLPGDLVLSPDNLDGQFVPPESFEQNLAPSYTRTARALHAGAKRLVVHVGGPVRGLLPGLVRCGVDCVQGISGPPQGDSTLLDARRLVGPGTALWGGIPQDSLLASCPDGEFRAVAEAAFAVAAADPCVVVGVADRVPADALPERISALAHMAAG
jgi:hypothetical protein